MDISPGTGEPVGSAAFGCVLSAAPCSIWVSGFDRLLNLDVLLHDTSTIRLFRTDANTCSPMLGSDFPQNRLHSRAFLIAYGHRMRNRHPDGGLSGKERRPSERCGGLSARHDKWHSRDQRLRVRHQRPSIQFSGGTTLHDLSEVHDANSIRDVLNRPQVMRNK